MNAISFRPWTAWALRQDIEGCGQPGVYLLGMFPLNPPHEVDPLAAEIIYIGETCDQNLRKRWYQFNRSAFEQKFGHSGGLSFASRFCEVREHTGLHVAALPVARDEPHRSAYIRFVERRLIWDYVQKFNALPRCNSK